MQIKTMRYHSTSIRIPNKNRKQGAGKDEEQLIRILIHSLLMEYKGYGHSGKQFGSFFQNDMHSKGPGDYTLGHFPREMNN